jgi:hypothetical protein
LVFEGNQVIDSIPNLEGRSQELKDFVEQTRAMGVKGQFAGMTADDW